MLFLTINYPLTFLHYTGKLRGRTVEVAVLSSWSQQTCVYSRVRLLPECCQYIYVYMGLLFYLRLCSKLTTEAPAIFYTKIAKGDGPFIAPDIRRSSARKVSSLLLLLLAGADGFVALVFFSLFEPRPTLLHFN